MQIRKRLIDTDLRSTAINNPVYKRQFIYVLQKKLWFKCKELLSNVIEWFTEDKSI